MYLRTISRRNKDGSPVRYLQLAHDQRGPVSGQTRAMVLYSFGREDELDRDALSRLARSLTRLQEPVATLVQGAAGADHRNSPPWIIEIPQVVRARWAGCELTLA